MIHQLFVLNSLDVLQRSSSEIPNKATKPNQMSTQSRQPPLSAFNAQHQYCNSQRQLLDAFELNIGLLRRCFSNCLGSGVTVLTSFVGGFRRWHIHCDYQATWQLNSL